MKNRRPLGEDSEEDIEVKRGGRRVARGGEEEPNERERGERGTGARRGASPKMQELRGRREVA